MSIENLVTALLAFISLIGALVTIYVSLRKAPHENISLDGDAANKYAQAAKIIADENIKMAQKIGDLEKRIEALEAQLQKEQLRSSKLENWAYRLTDQIKSLRIPGLTPVPLENSDSG